MSTFIKIVLIIFALAYFISPFDVLPDLLLPYFGYLDDIGLIGVILYIIRYNKLPGFLSKLNFKSFQYFQDIFNSQVHHSDKSTFKQQAKQTQNKKTDPKKSSKSAHEILGVKAFASKEEIQSAYKDAVKKYHPDKVSHLGEEFQKLANQKFLEIQKAYNTLMNTK